MSLFNWQQNIWAMISALAASVVLISALADRRRAHRKDVNAVGFMPWTAITVMSVMVAVIAAALAIKTG